MSKVEIYASPYCGFCVRAKALLMEKQVDFQEIRVDQQPGKRQEMMDRGGGYTVPQIFINEQSIGGCNELYALERQGQLDVLLSSLD